MGTSSTSATADLRARYEAIDRTQAIIEFDLDGTIRNANDNFLAAMGYTAAEIVGRHHRIFVPAEEADGPEYARFWETLRSGQHHSGQFRRVDKQGEDVWIEATYNPVFRRDKQVGVVKFATDITERMRVETDRAGQLAAIDRSMATIEFELDGTILRANDNFLGTMGYTADQVVGQHHRIFVDPAEAGSREYAAFWERLARGSFQSGEFRRRHRDGHDVWIQASYNPVLDPTGEPYKIVKFATDVTAAKQAALAIAESVSGLTDASTHIGSVSSELRTSSQQVSGEVNDIAAATEEITASLETLSAATDEMRATIVSVSDNASQAAHGADDAVEVAQQTTATVEQLARSSAEIGGVVRLIAGIAEQTNILALNASIAAARAGDAGQGFAVVATEVKHLAEQTAAATADISKRIEATQVDSSNAASAVEEISHTIERINDLQSEIAESIADQRTTTEEMSNNLTEAADASLGIAENMARIAELTQTATAQAAAAAEAAGSTRDIATELGRLTAVSG